MRKLQPGEQVLFRFPERYETTNTDDLIAGVRTITPHPLAGRVFLATVSPRQLGWANDKGQYELIIPVPNPDPEGDPKELPYGEWVFPYVPYGGKQADPLLGAWFWAPALTKAARSW